MSGREEGSVRAAVATAAWLLFTIAGIVLAAVAVPDVVSTGACSSTGQLSGSNRDVATCTDEQVASIVTAIAGIGIFLLGFLCTFRFIRGRDALVSRLVGGGIGALVVGGLAELRLQDADVIASMPVADLEGWRIGMLPLVIGGPVCLLVALIIVVVRLSRGRH